MHDAGLQATRSGAVVPRNLGGVQKETWNDWGAGVSDSDFVDDFGGAVGTGVQLCVCARPPESYQVHV